MKLWYRGVPLALGAFLLTAFLAACNASDDSSAAEPVKRVGLMHVGTDHVPPSLGTLKARLKELGWVEGKNIKLIWRNLEPDAAQAQADEFVFEHVDAIVAFEDTSIRAAQKATIDGRIAFPSSSSTRQIRSGTASSRACLTHAET